LYEHSIVPSQVLIRIDERTQVGEARRTAAQMTEALAFHATQAGKVAVTVTEAATNIVKHAGNGKILLTALSRAGSAGLEILALDRGPGISNVGASLRDGYSTAGSMGTGLGALSRAADSFDMYSLPGLGTALRLEIWAATAPPPDSFELGAVCLPKTGEVVCGDAWALESTADYQAILVADGLGHGPDAARASRAAVEAFVAKPAAPPATLMSTLHAALAGTRGAAGAVARVTLGTGLGTFAGVGNIACRVETPGARRQLVSHSGTLGHVMRRVQEFEFELPADALLILHSDGLATHWTLADYPGLMAKHAGLIAGVLYRDHERGRDDVTVVVLKHSGA
jgi:anti-sigma regulatory factor (Ser/Thr protein kinase)